MNKKQVHLSRIINYLIFAKEHISVFNVENDQQKVLFVATDLEGKLLKMRMVFQQEYGKIACCVNSSHLTALVQYNSRALKFELTLNSIGSQADNGNEKEFIFSVPDEATIIERRPAKRLKIADQINQFQVCIADLFGTILVEPEAIELYEVSITAISVWCLAGKIDLGHPVNDRIKIQINANGQKVLENTGYMHKTNRKDILVDRILIMVIFDRRETSARGNLTRLFNRINVGGGALTYITFHYPLIPDQQLFGYLEDLSESGARLVLRQGDKPMPTGLLLHNIEIQMPYCETLHIDGIVVYSRIGSATSEYEQTVGIRFAELRKDLQVAILYMTQRLLPALKRANLTAPLFVQADGNITFRISASINGKPCCLTSQDPIEFSHSRLRLTLNRTEGLLLPRHNLNKILLYRNDTLIADCSGIVEAVDFSGEKWLKNRLYMVTIRLVSLKEKKPDMEGYINRKRNRILLETDNAFTYIKADHPLCSQRALYGYLHDLSLQGMSFYVREAIVPLFPGLLLQNLSILFPFHRRITVNLFVTSCKLLEKDSQYQYRIGGQFKPLSFEGRNSVALAIQQVFNKHISEWSKDDFKKLWEFYFESGFIYSKKRQQISSYSQDIIDTYRKLLKRENPIFKVFIYKQDGDIKGHLSAIQFFDNAWMVQHLMAAKGANGSAAKAVLDPMIDFFDDLHAAHPDEQNYIFFFYREENTFPAIVFGNIREKAADKEISDSIELDFCLPKPYTPLIVDVNAQQYRHICREAGFSDIEMLETLLLSQGCLPVFQLEGLSKESLGALSLESEYKRLGLYRMRKVYVAEDVDTGARCFIVANYSSPGINFSELNNSFRIYYDNKNGETTAQLAASLTRHVLNSYIETGITKPALLCGTDQTPPPLFEKTKEYKYFYFNISQMDLFRSVTAESIQNLKKYIRKRHLPILPQHLSETTGRT